MPRKGGATVEVTEEDYLSLKEKFHLLEGDRKAYFETFENQKKQNDAQMKQLRAENGELRLAIGDLKKENSRSVDSDQELNTEMRKVARLRSEYDTRKNSTRKLKRELDKLNDQLHEFNLDAKKPNLEDNPLTRKIRMHENRLDKAMIKYNEAQSIRKTYEQIVKRLKDERVGFDNQLAAIERTLDAKENDHQELLLLAGDAVHAKDTAYTELERIKKLYQKNATQRAQELKDRELMVKQKDAMIDHVHKREEKRRDLIAKASGDLSEEQEDELRKALVSNKMQESVTSAELQATKEELQVFEDAFRQIKEATGVSDIGEVIQKIVSQGDTCDNLVQLTKENEAKLEKLAAQKQDLKQSVEELKYAGPVARSGGRKLVDGLEEDIVQASSRLEKAKARYERFNRTLIDVKAGIEHLQDKLQSAAVENKEHLPRNASIVDILYYCEGILTDIKGQVGDRLDAALETKAIAAPSVVTSVGQTTTLIDEEAMKQDRPYNRRINLPSSFDDQGGVLLDEEAYTAGDEELSRSKLKQKAKQLVIQRTTQTDKKTKKRRKKKKPGEGEDGEAGSAGDGAGGSPDTAAARRATAAKMGGGD